MRIRSTISAVVLALSVVACSGSDDGVSITESASVTDAASTPTAEADGEPTSVPAATASETPEETPPQTPAASSPLETFEPVATVPVDGVPGIESDDAFCQAWSEFAGTFQALALASNLAADATTARRSELAAAHAVGAALATMTDRFPSSIDEAGRQAFIDGLLGPFARRAAGAEATLLGAGLAPEEVAELGDLWMTTLSATGLGNPDIDVAVPASMQPAFAEALAAFESNVPAISADPSLVTDVTAEETAAYIAANCPDQGILGGNDFVGD